ncbi:MAG: LLM class flavin-dependent oxidoreductase, partial [Thermomicrobiales bacterium]
MNYGHPLQFGTFLTPAASNPERVVELAQTSESLGYDLVTFQDHPYQPSHLDTWTLMSWVAAKTERVRIAGNVHCLPLRPPAVLAKSAASLDLLSGGRVELGLGAGAFWDPIEAMGGRRLEPREAVDALDEAIDIIRGIWDVSERTSLGIGGEHYRVVGAQRGPAPAHDIPVLIGSYKPRMLRLTGQKGDGWLPSLPYLKPGDLSKGNAIIDAAAIEAGRDPREIRRMLNIAGRFASERGGVLNGPPESWVEDLLPMVTEDGIGTFIIMADDPMTMEVFIRQVAPALREAAERALPGAFAAGTIRKASALAKRRAGIDYDGIPAPLAGSAIEPGDHGYASVHSTYMRGGAPGLVLRVGDTDELAEALAYARRHR